MTFQFEPAFECDVLIPENGLVYERSEDFIRRARVEMRDKLLASFRPHSLTVHPGYCWDGATCAPDFRRVMRATVIHDLLCQLDHCHDWPHSRREADDHFYQVARADNFPLSGLYYAAVRLAGMWPSDKDVNLVIRRL